MNQLIDFDITDRDFGRAMQRIEPLLKKNPKNAGLHFLEGKVYAAQEKADLAEAAFLKALQLDPDVPGARDLLVAMYTAQGKLPKAISQLEDALSRHPDNPVALMTAAALYEKINEFQKARDAYEKVLTANPNFVVALNNLASLYNDRLGQSDKAYELAQKARTIQPSDPSVADTLGWIVYGRGDYQQALSLLQESAAKLPDSPEVQFHLGMAQYMMGDANGARSALTKALQGNTDFPGKAAAQNSLAQLEKTASPQEAKTSQGTGSAETGTQSNDLIAMLREAENYEKQGDLGKAESAYERAFKINPKLASTAVKLAELNGGALHQPARALEFARKARDLAPNDPQMAGRIGRVALKANNVTWANGLLQESARRGGQNPAVLHDLAITTYALGKIEDARRIMQQAMDAKPASDDAQDGKQFLMLTSSQLPSQTDIEAVLKAQPDYGPALMAQAAIAQQQKDDAKAVQVYQAVLQKYPDFAPAQKQLATIYAADLGKTQEAYDLAMKARKVLPGDPELARTLAEISFRRKEFPYAVQLFKESASKNPLPPEDLYYLGMAQLQSRQEASGLETLKKALAAGLQNPMAEEAKKRIAEQMPK